MATPTCPQCGVHFSTKWRLYAHTSFCTGRQLQINDTSLDLFLDSCAPISEEEEVEVVVHAFNDFNEHDEEQVDILDLNEKEVVEISNTYLAFQEHVQKKLHWYKNCQRDTMPMVKLTNGSFGRGTRSTYIDVVQFTAKKSQLSEKDCTDLINLIKKISSTYGDEIPLPSR